MPQTESFQSSSAVREISCNPHCIGWNSHLFVENAPTAHMNVDWEYTNKFAKA